jgi:uncharacterized RDD family membrane protein YckC
MICTNCGKEISSASKFCAFCGTAVQNSRTPPDVQAPSPSTNFNPYTPPASPLARQEQTAASPPRPWVRYWARMLDIYLVSILAGIAIGFVNPDAFNGGEQLLAMGAIFAWIFIEAFLLSTAGTTPGKWLFKIRLSTSSGDKLDFSSALSRSFKVWWRGLGTGFPIAALITEIVAYNRLVKNGMSTWDRDGGFIVTHERIGVIRILVAIAIFSVFLFFIVAGSLVDA